MFGPVGEVLNRLDEGATEMREVVFDAWGNFGVGVPADKAVPGEPAQRLSEHLAGDAADKIDQLAVSARAAA